QRRHASPLEALETQTPRVGRSLSTLPDTTTGRRGLPRLTTPVFVAAFAVVALVVVALALEQRGFSPGEELNAPGVEDIAASAEATPYPGSDALRFDAGIRVVYVYVRVEDLAVDGGLEARVRRSNMASVVTRMFPGGDLRLVDANEDQLGVSDAGVSGVVGFAVRAGSGRPLPAGDYTVGVYAAGEDSRGPLAEKYFVVED
ncbi:MAG: hypothetical protein ACRDTR_16115, partial [Rubrobacter sp.]